MKHNALSFVLLFFSFHISCMVEFQSIPVETMKHVMSNLDYKANVRFIMTCKKLHDFYAEKENNGLLFTNHYLNSTDYMNAMIHFSRKNDVEKVNLLMEHEGEENKNNREDIALYFNPNRSTIYEDAIDVYRREYDKDSVLDVRRLMKEPAVLELALKQGYQNFNYCDEKGNTQLHYAIFLDDVDYYKSLLSLHTLVNPNIKNDLGHAPLFFLWAIFSIGIDRKIEMLYDLRAHPQFNPNVPDSDGNTFLHFAAITCRTDDAIKFLNCLLSDERTDPNIKDKNGNTPLYHSLSWCNTELFNCLLADPRVDCNIKNNKGYTAYDHVLLNPEVKRLLAPRMSFINKHKQQMIALMYKIPDLIRLGGSIAIMIDLIFFGGKRTSETLHTITKAFGY